MPEGQGAAVRLDRQAAVAGLDPEYARSLARLAGRYGSGPDPLPAIAARAGRAEGVVAGDLDALAAAGYLDPAASPLGRPAWRPTVAGAALAMATFRRPIRRATATALLDAAVARAAAYNQSPGPLLLIERVRVFGSYLDPDADRLGDLDLAATLRARTPDADDPEARLDYARASGRSFPTLLDAVGWPEQEATRVLRGRSASIHVTLEDVARLTDRWADAYVLPTGAGQP